MGEEEAAAGSSVKEGYPKPVSSEEMETVRIILEILLLY